MVWVHAAVDGESMQRAVWDPHVDAVPVGGLRWGRLSVSVTDQHSVYHVGASRGRVGTEMWGRK